MPAVQQLLEGDWPNRLTVRGLPTGLNDLDSITNGLLPGTVWVVAGTPGVGRTVLACQIAKDAALGGQGTVAFLSGREHPDTILVNVVCAHARVSAHHLLAGQLSQDDHVRLAHAREQLSGAHLRILFSQDRVWQHDHGSSTPNLNLLIGRRAPAAVLVVDDVDSLLDKPLIAALPALRAWCRSANFTLVVSVPEEQVLLDGHARPEYRREADVVLRLARDDQLNLSSPRAGEADLHVLRHRAGPTGELKLAFQGHYRRFVELR